MNASSATTDQIQRALRKVSEHLSALGHTPLSDIYLQVMPESGDLFVYDDTDTELWRCVVEEWIGRSGEDFYAEAAAAGGAAIRGLRAEMEALNLQKPYSFVLTDEDKETVCELYLVDDDLLQISGELMEGLSEDLDRFWAELSKDM